MILFFYNLGLLAVLILGAPWWLFRMATTHKYREGLLERLGWIPARLIEPGEGAADERPVIWLHAVSVGEVLAASRLVKELDIAFPGHRLVISTTTRTGQALARERFGAGRVFYCPLDLPWAVRSYLNALQPRLFILAETEFWPNLLSGCFRRGIPVAVVNARVSDRSWPRYRRLRLLWRPFLSRLSQVLAQSQDDADRLNAIGCLPERVSVAGNLKFDIRVAGAAEATRLLKAFKHGLRLVVAGSTLEGEEAALIEAWPHLLEADPRLVLILAPRHPERFGAVESLLEESGICWVKRSDWQGKPAGSIRLLQPGQAVLLDTIGELASVYSVASVAIVGGSLFPAGGHNPLEPAQFGVPIVMGSHYPNFRAMTDLLVANDAIRIVEPEALSEVLIELLRDRPRAEAMGARAKQFFDQQAGATDRCVEALRELLAAEPQAAVSAKPEVRAAEAIQAAAEIGMASGKISEEHTAACEARVDLIGILPGINPRPRGGMSFSAACRAGVGSPSDDSSESASLSRALQADTARPGPPQPLPRQAETVQLKPVQAASAEPAPVPLEQIELQPVQPDPPQPQPPAPQPVPDEPILAAPVALDPVEIEPIEAAPSGPAPMEPGPGEPEPVAPMPLGSEPIDAPSSPRVKGRPFSKRTLLLPLTPAYRLALWLRERRLGTRAEPVRRLRSPVVSIGNLSTGGAGKTPLTIALAKALSKRGLQVNVLSRGYGRRDQVATRVALNGSAEEFGDEPLLIARNAGVAVYVASERYGAGLLAEGDAAAIAFLGEAVKPVVHLLDDGFQHRQLHRDVDILLLNREDWTDHLLPAGNLRESRNAIRRAGLVAIPDSDPELEDEIRARGWEGTVWRLRRHMDVPTADGPVAAFCGIARPEQFFAGLEAAGAQLVLRKAFPDHHPFTATDLDGTQESARAAGAVAIFTTEKDQVRLGSLFSGIASSLPVKTASLRVEIEDEEEAVAWLVDRLYPAPGHPPL